MSTLPNLSKASIFLGVVAFLMLAGLLLSGATLNAGVLLLLVPQFGLMLMQEYRSRKAFNERVNNLGR